MALFTRDELAHYAQDPHLTYDETAIVERVVSGWLADAGITVAPGTTVPPQVFSWALELAAIAHENPSALSSRSVDGISDTYDRDAALSVLTRARQSTLSTTGGRLAPIATFPTTRVWPDPVEGSAW